MRMRMLLNVGLLFCAISSASGQIMATLETVAPFSFVYDGKPAQEFLSSWPKSETVRSLSGGRTLRTVTYRGPATHLEVSREITTILNKNAMEWVLRLRNGGSQDSPMLEKILPLDLDVPVPASGDVIFHQAYGSSSSTMDYVPVDKDLSAGTKVQLAHYILVNGLHKGNSARHTHDLPPYDPQQTQGYRTLEQAAQYLGVSANSVRRMIKLEKLHAEQVVPCAPWRISVAILDSEEIRQAVRNIKSGSRVPRTLSTQEQESLFSIS
jgi:hypothetical protein